MGNWALYVQGVGAHHNKAFEDDANRMFARFVKDLRDAGHQIQVAVMTHGAAESVVPNGVMVEMDTLKAGLIADAWLPGTSMLTVEPAPEQIPADEPPPRVE